MNSRQYAKQQLEHLQSVLAAAGITEYSGVVLSADRTEYEVTLSDGTIKIIPSGFDYFED